MILELLWMNEAFI